MSKSDTRQSPRNARCSVYRKVDKDGSTNRENATSASKNPFSTNRHAPRGTCPHTTVDCVTNVAQSRTPRHARAPVSTNRCARASARDPRHTAILSSFSSSSIRLGIRARTNSQIFARVARLLPSPRHATWHSPIGPTRHHHLFDQSQCATWHALSRHASAPPAQPIRARHMSTTAQCGESQGAPRGTHSPATSQTALSPNRVRHVARTIKHPTPHPRAFQPHSATWHRTNNHSAPRGIALTSPPMAA
ncbi:hypothetical protein Syun_004197 [Stephania yunnanensis]|uniref:Uncharacterized protein n=1 Tax=Stephania yunnanensis TaxID=152371 RepID=A0AAP0L3I4_9MAGN